jgi:hypothetical protein
MTDTRAKEIIISAMNYIAYAEFDTSLYTSDRNRLFGSDHFVDEPFTAPPERPSPWAGSDSEEKLANVLALASTINNPDFDAAIATLLNGDHYLTKIIRLAQGNQFWKGPRSRVPFDIGVFLRLALAIAIWSVLLILIHLLVRSR